MLSPKNGCKPNTTSETSTAALKIPKRPEAAAPVRATTILARGETPNAVYSLHQAVFEFRAAHKLNGKSQEVLDSVIRRYPISKAPAEEMEAIRVIAQPQKYSDLRHAGKLHGAYPPLPVETLRSLCREIRAALVWNACCASSRW